MSGGSIPAVSNVAEYFELVRCAQWCGEYSSVALQFPDHLLPYSTQVAEYLSSPGRRVHILADTNYGSCCVDEVAAQRLSTAAIIHFGHSCGSRVLSLPTLFVFGAQSVNVESIEAVFRGIYTAGDYVTVILDTPYYHCRSELVARLRSFGGVVVQRRSLEQNTPQTEEEEHVTDHVSEHVFYVGGESLALTNCILTNGSRKVHSFDPVTGETRLESRRVNKLLIKRFANIEKIKECEIVGILVGTLGIKHFREVIERVKQVCKAAGKKHYVVSIGKPNPAKLGNFLEIAVFVMVGCAENSLLDCAEFYQPIVTPYELEIACVDRPWEVDYISDCSTLISDANCAIPSVTGPEEEEGTKDRQLSEKFRTLDLAVNFLHDRTWSGLQQRLGEDEPAVLREGQRGIAGFYENETVCDSRMSEGMGGGS